MTMSIMIVRTIGDINRIAMIKINGMVMTNMEIKDSWLSFNIINGHNN